MSTATDERVELDVDLDATVPCESPLGCEDAAAWHTVARPCGHAVNLCDGHKSRAQRRLRQLKRSRSKVICNFGTEGTHTVVDIAWQPL